MKVAASIKYFYFKELINRNMFTSSTSFSNANQLESIYSVEKSLAKNLNLNG
jgi:hypothetical protein